MTEWVKHKWTLAILLILISGGVFFYNIGKISLWDPDEPRGAVIASEILKNGDWIHLSYNGEPISSRPALVKPPLYYWSIAAFSRLIGRVNEFSARLPSVLAGIGTVLCVFFLGRRIFGWRAAFLGALVFISNHMIFEQARSAEIDMTLCLFITLSLFTFYYCYHGIWKGKTLFAAYIFMGLAVLAKGPVGVIVPVMVALLYLLVRRDLKAVPKLYPVIGLFLILLIASPWFFLEGKAFGLEFFFRQNFQRFFHAFDHRQPFYYYLVKLPVHFLPWTLILPATFAYWWKSGKEKNPGRTFLLIWFLSVFLFFSLSQSKRSLYIVPLYPALALLVGEFLDQVLRGEPFVRLSVWIKSGGAVLATLMILTGGGALYLAQSRYHDLWLPAAGLTLLLVTGAGLLFQGMRQPGGRAIITAFFVTAFGLELLLAGIIYPELDVKSRSSKKLCSMVARKVGEHDLGCVGFHPPSAVFYINRERRRNLIDFGYNVRDGISFLEQKKKVYCLMNRNLYEKEKQHLQAISRKVILPGLPLKGWKWDLVFLTNRLDEDRIRI